MNEKLKNFGEKVKNGAISAVRYTFEPYLNAHEEVSRGEELSRMHHRSDWKEFGPVVRNLLPLGGVEVVKYLCGIPSSYADICALLVAGTEAAFEPALVETIYRSNLYSSVKNLAKKHPALGHCDNTKRIMPIK